MLKKDLYFFLEDFPDDIEVCFWSNGKAHPVEVIKDDKTRNCILLNTRKEESVGVTESPSKTFPRVNEFDCGSSYRH